MDFKNFRFDPRILSGIQASGYAEPTPIQNKAIPVILEGQDVVGLAQTGTGKTAAFVLPLLQQLLTGQKGRLRALIIVPTRELAEQIHQTIRTLGRDTGLRSTTLYGGVNLTKQFQMLRRGVDIAIACPGRLLDHIDRQNMDFSHLQFLVLDEADQMFDFGFLPAIRKILGYLPKKRQSLLFSATMPKAIRLLADEILKHPVSIQIGALAPATTVEQRLYPVSEGLKTALLIRLLQEISVESVLIFTRTRYRAKRLAEHLEHLGYRSTSFQGNLTQSRRQIALDQFRRGVLQILVATDIAARGIDVANVSHVINFDMPATTDAYTHRIGRTGRATKLGAAYTLITKSDQAQVRAIERLLKQPIEKCILPDFNYQEKGNRDESVMPAERPQRATGYANKRSASSTPKKSGYAARGTSHKDSAQKTNRRPGKPKLRRTKHKANP